jgi:hypothetical protein
MFNLSQKPSSVSMFLERWFWSSNAKDIGTLYLMFALFAGLVGTAFSVLIRMELSAPGVQYIGDNQLYNSIITAHAIVMIFFMVKLYANEPASPLLVQSSLIVKSKSSILIDDVNNSPVGNNNNPKPNQDNNKIESKYTKILIEDPYNNRDIVLKITKGQKGVYIWETLDGKNIYVGHSINLYNRISSYFMPSILKTKAGRVLIYLNKHGFSSLKLTVFLMHTDTSLNKIIALEQQFIDSLNPNLNLDLIATSSGYHEPMPIEIREKLGKLKGIPVYFYKADDLTLLYVFDSKQYMYNKINIHHNTLDSCINTGSLYLDTFFLSLDKLEETTYDGLLDPEDLIKLVNLTRDRHRSSHPSAKAILAKFKDDPSKDLGFNSLNSLAKYLKGDRQVIRDYLTGIKPGYYRGKWKFSYKKG